MTMIKRILIQIALLLAVMALSYFVYLVLKGCYYLRRKREIRQTEKEYTDSIETVDELQKRFYENPTEFENYCAMIFDALGYEQVTVTSKSNDGGKDLIMYKNDEKCIAEVKLYSRDYNIGREKIQKLHSAMLDSDAKHAVFVTTSDFTATALAYAGKHEIDLINGFLLNRLIHEVMNGTTKGTADITFLKDYIVRDFDKLRDRDHMRARRRAAIPYLCYIIYGVGYLVTVLNQQNYVMAVVMILCLAAAVLQCMKNLLSPLKQQ